MRAKAHKVVTRKAIKLCNEREMFGPSLVGSFEDSITKMTGETDSLNDLEFVNVEFGMDDPHKKDEWSAYDDDARHDPYGNNLAAFNHFIDMRKGRGLFDDYDGYSYRRGSAHLKEYQDVNDSILIDGIGNLVASIVSFFPAKVGGMMTDEAMNWLLNDEYIHAPGDQWYDKCSPSLERYSYYQEFGKYRKLEDEMKHRFPLASSNSARPSGTGVPWSVFMPLDNMGRYWYENYVAQGNFASLGHVVHAVQDASVPHHVAGCLGNWHAQYEDELDSRTTGYFDDREFVDGIRRFAKEWCAFDDRRPPLGRLVLRDIARTPSKTWRIDQLITWVGLNAFKEYSDTYNNFKHGFSLDETSFKRLIQLAAAMSILVYRKAEAEPEVGIFGNKRTKELHRVKCSRVKGMKRKNVVGFNTPADAYKAGYDGCHYCMDAIDRR